MNEAAHNTSTIGIPMILTSVRCEDLLLLLLLLLLQALNCLTRLRALQHSITPHCQEAQGMSAGSA
jgi:hypothetical protein